MTAVLPIFLPAILAALVADGPAALRDSPIPAPNPHWQSNGCTQCHTAKDGNIERIAPEQIDRVCLRCHDGVKAKAEAHPIGRSFASNQVRKPEDWPTPGGLLSCITCHDVLQGCHMQRRSTNQAMLRGPSRGVPSLCNQCHVAEKQQQRNPHAAMKGAYDSNSCLFCHQQEMQPTAQQRTGEPKLKNDEITLCGQCHHQHPDFFAPGHIGVAAPTAIVRNMQQADQNLVAQSPEQEPALLPLHEGKVVCSTCHNPHLVGVFSEGNILGRGAMSFETASENYALRIPGPQLCLYCHGAITRKP